MENLWKMIAKARGVALDEVFLYSWGNLKHKYRIKERGLEYYDDDKSQWTFSECSSEFIRGIGKLEKIPFVPKLGEYYWTYTDCGGLQITIVLCVWESDYSDKERKLLGIVFRTEQEAKDYLPTWKKRLEDEEC